ncbi:glycosyltransferase family 2 protein [Pseudorhizobium endolithicum]|uniref:Glycosyltransferase family 2 protein n=1 Tax=Pseudorhizobium endolithicum TaxID=1191678 RepID=A0ABN7JRL3_9HYPH|nr:glycosyltransferase family 2 protein [Pseudorhizobium endolithicum]CAD7044518.1 glycosyltransferase family 2 protein [Pseudorhizobium endolithicum]
MARIDVAVPNYNYGRFLQSCVNSIYRQGIDGIRILIIDNASTDDSAAIARRLAERDPNVELCLRTTNLGQHASFNAAVDWAQSEYFVILCSDDYLADGALQRAINALDRHRDASLAFGGTLFVEEGSPRPAALKPQGAGCLRYWSGTDFLRATCRSGRNLVGGPLAVVRTAAQKAAGHYCQDLQHTDDMEMWMRLAAIGAVVELDDVLAIVRLHGENRSAILADVLHWNRAAEAAFESFFAGFGASLPDAKSLFDDAKRCLSDRAYWAAISHLIQRQPGAPELAKQAVALRPACIVLPPLGYAWRKTRMSHRLKQMWSSKKMVAS